MTLPRGEAVRTIKVMVEPGNVLLGKYRIERMLGRGGMGVVALAHHLQLDQPVAIKLLRPKAADNPQIVERFLREARAAVKLKSAHVCHVYDVGRLANDAPFIVMEYLDGVDLGDFLASFPAPPPWVAVDWILQASEALAEAHSLGIIHRDVKPANLFLSRGADGCTVIKVLDFGISKASAAGDVELTQSYMILGTPSYMAPEQMRSGRDIDARIDIWALGAVLYRLLSGRRPFETNEFAELCVKMAVEPVPPMGVALPAALDAAVMRCLEKAPEDRFQNMAELAAALAPHASSPVQAAHTTQRTARILGVIEPPPTATEYELLRSRGGAPRPPSTLRSGAGQVGVTQAGQRRRPRLIAGAIGLAIAGCIAVGVSLDNASPQASPQVVEPTRIESPTQARQAATAPPSALDADDHAAPPGQIVDAGVVDPDLDLDVDPDQDVDASVDAHVADAAVPDAADRPRERKRTQRTRTRPPPKTTPRRSSDSFDWNSRK